MSRCIAPRDLRSRTQGPHRGRKGGAALIYFFSKGQEFVRCEIHPGRPHVFRIIDASGVEQVERHHSDEDLQTRWNQVTSELAYDGWTGPFGRDNRV